MVCMKPMSHTPWYNMAMCLVLTLVLLGLQQPVACEYTELGDECTTCQAGKYMDQTGQTACTSCIAGSWFDLTGGDQADDCNKCGVGTFSDTVAATNAGTCDDCPAGMLGAFFSLLGPRPQGNHFKPKMPLKAHDNGPFWEAPSPCEAKL